jgi:hypothetical protein
VLFEHTVFLVERDWSYTTDDELLGSHRRIHSLLTEECGYRIFDLDGSGPLSAADFASVVTEGTRMNFMACP